MRQRNIERFKKNSKGTQGERHKDSETEMGRNRDPLNLLLSVNASIPA